MKEPLVICILLLIAVGVESFKPKMILATELINSQCMPENEADIASSDRLVEEMYKAYKTQAAGETPPAEHADEMVDVEGHELLGRLLFFMQDMVQNRELHDNQSPNHDLINYVFSGVTSDERRWADDRKWPFRCYDVATAKALDLFLTSVTHRIFRIAMSPETNHALASLLFAIPMAFPQFEKYVVTLPLTSINTMCDVIKTSQELADTIDDLVEGTEMMLPMAETACQPPYDARFYCDFKLLHHDLSSMHKDLSRAEAKNSQEMMKFALFWLFDSYLARTCETSTSSLNSDILIPYARLATARLNHLVDITSTTGSNLEKIREFVYDPHFTLFSHYATEGGPNGINAAAPFNTPGTHFTTFLPHQHNDITIPPPEKDLIFAFRAYLKVLVEIENVLIEGGDVVEVQTLARLAMFWFLHPDFQLGTVENYLAFLDGMNHMMNNAATLTKFGNALKQYKPRHLPVCDTDISETSFMWCKLYQLLSDIREYSTILHDDPRVKIIKPDSNYRKILERATMREMQSQITALEIGQDGLKQALLDMSSTLGDHFHQLARFDQDKAEYDVGYLQDKIADFDKRIAQVGLQEKLSELLNLATGANLGELFQLGTQLAAEIANNCNPLKWLTGSGGIQDILDRANDLAQAGVTTAELVNIGREILPKLVVKANTLKKAMDNNAVIHDHLNTTFHQIKGEEDIDIDAVQANFLVDYRGYDPGWSKGDIADYTVLLKEAIDALCENLFEGGTVGSAVAEGIAASKGTCLNIKTDAEVLDAVYNEMYDFQYEFMDAMAMAIRALVAKHSSNTLRDLPEVVDDPEKYNLQLKMYAYRIKLQSKQHVLLGLKDVCDVDEYKNGGFQTQQCKEALRTQAPLAIDEVLGNGVTQCPTNHIEEVVVHIPAQINPEKRTLAEGTIDLTKLYSGQPTEFQIPFSTGVGNFVQKFISPLAHMHEDVALYLHRFEIYLPELQTETSVVHDLGVTIKKGGAAKARQSSAIRYGFANPTEFTLKYGEHKHRCVNDFQESVYPALCSPVPTQVCVTSNGLVSESEVAPPLHSQYLIQAYLPRNFEAPEPHPNSKFYLRGIMAICTKNPENVEFSNEQPIESSSTTSDKCCPGNQYWFITDEWWWAHQGCEDCPTNSTVKLGGLYCDQRIPGPNSPDLPDEPFDHHHLRARKHHTTKKHHLKIDEHHHRTRMSQHHIKRNLFHHRGKPIHDTKAKSNRKKKQ